MTAPFAGAQRVVPWGEPSPPGCGVLTGLNEAPSSANCTVTLNTGNGMERLVVMRTTQMFDDDGNLSGVVATIKDITEESAPDKRAIIAESAPMREVLNFVRLVAASEATTILLEGENGTGKDLVAKTLHYQSLRQAEPFIAINCAAIPETLLESELFGYEKGAFTDAQAQKRGTFELIDKGTLFLDEIGEIPLMHRGDKRRHLEGGSENQTSIQLGWGVLGGKGGTSRSLITTGISLPPSRDNASPTLPVRNSIHCF